MTWMRTDDGFPEHPKADALAAHFDDDWATLAVAFTTWHHMACDCAARETDGVFLPARAHRVIRAPREVIDKALDGLVAVGLLERKRGEFTFHDWADYQPTREQLVADRKAKAERQARWRSGKQRVGDARVDASTAPSQDASKDAAPSRPVPTPKNPLPNPLPQAEGGSEVDASPSKSIERPATTSATCSTVEHLGTDPHEVALVLGASVPRLRHFPGGARDDFRRAAAPLRIEWPVLAAWLAAGGTRRHRSGRVTWAWLIGHGGAPLAECWALAQEWASKGRPALDDRGEIAAPKPAPEAAKPSPLRVVASPLAWLEDAPARISPEAIERAKAQAAARVANG